TIDGLLNANGNNVFLINPNGVIITKTGTINANRFVASTSSMSNEDMQRFANMSNFNDGLSFSPVFKPQKAGNVVNMGNINADKVLLIGNKVDIQGGKLGNANSTTHLVGNYVYIDADSANLNSTINVTATQNGYIQRQMNKFANDNYNFGNYTNIQNTNYTETNGQTHNGSNNFKKVLTIGNMENEKANATEWFYFAKGWNENKGDTQNIDEFRLVGNVDFDNIATDPVGINSQRFNKKFNGNGYTLSNVLINTDSGGAGLFGWIESADISNLNIDTINFDYSKGIPSSIGAFAYTIFNSKISNININNIGDLKASGENTILVGGFSAQINSSDFDNIHINGIKSIKVESYADELYAVFIGGFGGRLSNYDLSNQVGGNPNNFSNITIRDIGSFSAISRNNRYNLAIGGFSASLYEVNNLSNVFLYFNENFTINTRGFENTYIGKFTGMLTQSRYNFSNIHLYHHENSFLNANNDYAIQNDFNTNGYVSNKINIHTYNDNTQESNYQDFLSKANTIEKPILPSNPSNPPDLTDTNVKLDENDLHQDIINEIINDITNNHYELSIANLLNMLKDKTNYTNMNEEQKTNFIAKYFLKGDTTKALEVVQSLDFLLAYENNGLSTASNDKFEANGLSVKNTLIANTKKTIKNKNDLFDFLSDDLKNLVVNYNQNITDLKTAQEQLKIAIAKYNDYVKKVNENPSIKNDATLNALKAEVDRLDNLSKELFASINNNQELLQTYQDKTSTDSNNHFKIIGKFDNVALLIPNLDEIVVDGNENEDYKKVSRQVANAQKQTPTFEYEEDEKEEVEEASMKQRSRTCIVSDNYKTMNPCVVGGI
ncbi:filamentous hemagglutinin N-terminal domain-containing protein, partial [Campylobacter armoricus]|uniref:two-partner secretion domain-containing protein n=1 Tax=Campylobacter armoricus TaxID=2505970 RepID=UPI001115BE1C